MSVNQFAKNFSKNVQYLRQKNDLTQAEMAAIIGISVSTLRRLEAAHPDARVHCVMLDRVCDHFGISADVMLRERLEKMDG